MINSSFSTQISQREFDENVTDDYISGFKENITKYNMKRVRIAGLSPYDSMISEGVFDEREQREDKYEQLSLLNVDYFYFKTIKYLNLYNWEINNAYSFQFNDISFISFEFQNKETDESIVKSVRFYWIWWTLASVQIFIQKWQNICNPNHYYYVYVICHYTIFIKTLCEHKRYQLC